jgi:hypothetical protein
MDANSSSGDNVLASQCPTRNRSPYSISP